MKKWRIITATNRERTRFDAIPTFSEGLYDINNNIYAWMVPNGSWGESNAGLVVGEGEALLVDTLWDLNYTGEMLQSMRPITQTARIKYIVNTHADGDHIWGNNLVNNAEIIMTKACAQEAREMKPFAMTMLGKTGRALGMLGFKKANIVGNYFYSMVSPYNFTGARVKSPTRVFDNQLALDVGGREVMLIEVGPAHTKGDLMVFIPDAKTLFCGDMLFIGSTPVIWAGPVENWISALEMILDMDAEVIVPGHGPICNKSAVLQVKGYWEYLRRETHTKYKHGKSAKDAAYEIALDEDFSEQAFSMWDSPERIMTNVHVIYRHLQGKTEHLNAAEKLSILQKQALLASKLPKATSSELKEF